MYVWALLLSNLEEGQISAVLHKPHCLGAVLTLILQWNSHENYFSLSQRRISAETVYCCLPVSLMNNLIKPNTYIHNDDQTQRSIVYINVRTKTALKPIFRTSQNTFSTINSISLNEPKMVKKYSSEPQFLLLDSEVNEKKNGFSWANIYSIQ